MPSQPPLTVDDEAFLQAFAQTRAFMLGRPVKPAISPDGREILFLRSEPRSSRHDLFAFDLGSQKMRCLCSAASLRGSDDEELTEQEKARRERQRVTDTGLTNFEVSPDGQWVLIPVAGALYLLQRSTGKSRALLPPLHLPVMDARFTPGGLAIAFVCEHDLWILEVPTSLQEPCKAARPLTTGGTATRFFGLPEFVAQEEMGRFEGYWFAPDSQRALVAVVDERDVEVFSIADPSAPERPPATFRYPRPGKANADVGLTLVSRTDGVPPLFVKWDHAAYPYLARVLWQSDAVPPAIWVQSRDQKRAALLSIDQVTGNTSVLFEEHDDAWINLDAMLPRFAPDGSALLHVCESSGARELQLRAADGKLIRTLVPAEAGFLQFVSVDSLGARALVLLGDALTSRLAWVALNTTDRFAPQWFVEHDRDDQSDRSSIVVGGPACAPLVLETRVCTRTTPTVRVLDAAGNVHCHLPDTAEPLPLAVSLRFVEASEHKFHAVVVRPTLFDDTRKYPVIVHVYGGPHALMVKSDQRQYVFDQWLANRGAIVVAIDGRGTPRRGRQWERSIKDGFGTVPLHDQIEALEALGRQEPQMDMSRVGIYGWSFGGFMAALAALRCPGNF